MLYSEWKRTRHRTVGRHQKVGTSVLCDSNQFAVYSAAQSHSYVDECLLCVAVLFRFNYKLSPCISRCMLRMSPSSAISTRRSAIRAPFRAINHTRDSARVQYDVISAASYPFPVRRGVFRRPEAPTEGKLTSLRPGLMDSVGLGSVVFHTTTRPLLGKNSQPSNQRWHNCNYQAALHSEMQSTDVA